MGDGATQRDHAESAARQLALLGKKKTLPIVDSGPECPAALFYLWRWFCEHSNGLNSSGFAPPVVTWEGLAAWCGLLRIEMEPWECRVMVRLGALRAMVLSEDLSKPKPQGSR